MLARRRAKRENLRREDDAATVRPYSEITEYDTEAMEHRRDVGQFLSCEFGGWSLEIHAVSDDDSVVEEVVMSERDCLRVSCRSTVMGNVKTTRLDEIRDETHLVNWRLQTSCASSFSPSFTRTPSQSRMLRKSRPANPSLAKYFSNSFAPNFVLSQMTTEWSVGQAGSDSDCGADEVMEGRSSRRSGRCELFLSVGEMNSALQPERLTASERRSALAFVVEARFEKICETDELKVILVLELPD